MIQREILQDAPVALRALVEGPTGRKAACQLYALPGRVAAAGIIAICRAAVTQERAVAWVNGLFENVRAERVICLSCMPVCTSLTSPRSLFSYNSFKHVQCSKGWLEEKLFVRS